MLSDPLSIEVLGSREECLGLCVCVSSCMCMSCVVPVTTTDLPVSWLFLSYLP